MKPLGKRWGDRIAPVLRDRWAEHRMTLLCVAVVLMAVAALIWLGYEFWRLLSQSAPIWQSSPTGAIDLKLRHAEVHRWFAGLPVYGVVERAVYPPASYAMLWPLLGWLALTPARWLWAATTVAALGWLAYLIVHETGADTPLERVFVVLMPLSMYATGGTIGNGQLIVHVLPILVAGLLLVRRGQCGWRGDLLAAALVSMTLVKPSVSVPFFWVVCFLPGRLRPILLISLGYAAVTLFAASFQEAGLPTLLQSWLGQRSQVSILDSHANFHKWLAGVGLEEWMLPVSLITLVVLGFWTYCHRHGDVWLILGVTALVARFWTYHRWYDDLLILLPMVALFRTAKRGPSADGSDVTAGLLLAITILAMLAPGGLYLFPSPWNMLYVSGQMMVWIAVLIFLLERARWEKNTGVA